MLESHDQRCQPAEEPESGFPLRWTWTLTLVMLYVAVEIIKDLTLHYFPAKAFIFQYLALSREGIAHGYVWQFLTYQFLHAGWLHLGLNCWGIFMFGSLMEDQLGARRYLALVVSSGIMGGVFQVLTAVLWPNLFNGTVVGASAGLFGLVAAVATLLPAEELIVVVLFVIPVRMRVRTLFRVSIVIALMGILFPPDQIIQGAYVANNVHRDVWVKAWAFLKMGWDTIGGAHVANAAHLGGMAMGWLYVRKIMKNPAPPHGAEPAHC